MTTSGPLALFPAHDAISERAAEFLRRRRFESWSEAEQAELDQWLAASALHRVAWLRVEGAVARAEHLIARAPNEFRRSAPDGEGVSRWRLPLLAAASLALFAALGAAYVNSLTQEPDRTYSTEVGGRSLLRFADGTVIDLNTDTAVRFRMTRSERKVWLEKGEAWFHVAHDAANPFTVFAGRHRITDLGTEFLVRRTPDRMEVALLNGRAELSAEGAPSTTLAPGDDAVATPVSMSVTRKTAQELADAVAWRQGVLVFRNTRLADVVREFNRYNATKLVIADPSVADVKIYAEIKTDHFDDLLSLVHTVLNLRVDRQGGVIFISREPRKIARHGAP